MKRNLIILTFVTGIALCGYAQNVSTPRCRYDYNMVRMDSTFDRDADPKLASYVLKQKHKLDLEMEVVIGSCEESMSSFAPASPLSNFLTDVLLNRGPQRIDPTRSCDISMLNFGGIRSQMSAGNVSVGDIFAISPFDNYLVLVEMKGSELLKCLKRFTEKFNAAYSGAQITYSNGRATQIKVNGQPIDEQRIYRLITLNFIVEGGDNLLSDIAFEKVTYSEVTFRDFLIDEIRMMTKEGKNIRGHMDDRAKVLPSPHK